MWEEKEEDEEKGNWEKVEEKVIENWREGWRKERVIGRKWGQDKGGEEEK